MNYETEDCERKLELWEKGLWARVKDCETHIELREIPKIVRENWNYEIGMES